MNYENIIKSIETLAPLSDALIKIQNLFNVDKEELDINALVKLIESDTVLTINILKMANSPLYGFSNKISSVMQAVTLFGIMQIYAFIMSYSVHENIKANTEIYGLSNKKFNDICTIQSALLLQWYSCIDIEDARFLAPLALIMETGKLVVSNSFDPSNDILEDEREFLNVSSYEISSKVFAHWYMEPLYIRILKDLNEDSISEKIQGARTILKIIITAVNIESLLTKDSVLKACKLVKDMGEDPNLFAKTALTVKKAYVNGL